MSKPKVHFLSNGIPTAPDRRYFSEYGLCGRYVIAHKTTNKLNEVTCESCKKSLEIAPRCNDVTFTESSGATDTVECGESKIRAAGSRYP